MYIYICFLYIADDAFNVDPLTGDDIYQTCNEGSPTSPGLDHWTPGEFRLLSRKACCILADLLNFIETGAPWPNALTQAKGSFLSKDPSRPYDALDYRILLVLPVLYRKWGTTRLRHLGPWIQTWVTDSMFAGVPGASANDAWYASSVDHEYAYIISAICSGAGMDIHKCLDKIMRRLHS